jgi:hypothetical protein
MGFDTDTVLYHGTNKDFDSFQARETKGWEQDGKGVSLDRHPSIASGYANQRSGLSGDGANVLPVYIRGKLATRAEWESAVERSGGDTSQAQAVLEKAGFAGFQSPTAGMGGGKVTGEVRIFDPSNIRSVNAAFDPKKSTSSTLLAAAPFAAVGGAGLTIERELGSKMQRDKKD